MSQLSVKEVWMAIPKLGSGGELPPGIYLATILEVEEVFGQSSERRKKLMAGLKTVISIFKNAGVRKVYLDGSFTTNKVEPADIDGCWSMIGVNLNKLDKRFWDFKNLEDLEKNRNDLKKLFGIDFYIMGDLESESRRPFPLFFQRNLIGEPKGIIQIEL